MKQFVFLLAVIFVGGIGSMQHPFWGLVVYYFFASLRPQYIWSWSLPSDWRWSMIAAVMTFVACLWASTKILRRARITPILVLMGLFSLMLLGSFLTAHDPETSSWYAMEWAKILLMAMLTCLVVDRLSHYRVMMLVTLVALGYAAYELNYLYIFNGRLEIYRHGYGGLDNNGAGLMFAMAMPLAYAFGITAERWWQRAAAWTVALLLLHVVLMSYSRGAMLSSIVGGAWLLWKHRPRKQAAVIFAAVVVALTLLAGPEIRERFISTKDYRSDSSATSRFESWGAAWRMTWESPLFGQGIRNANTYSANYGADVKGRTIHSQYLQISADTGVPAGMTFVLILVTAMVSLNRCGHWIEDFLEDAEKPSSKRPRISEARRENLTQTLVLSRAMTASLLIFATGAAFLSLELLELPWLMFAMAANMPHLL
ncbi:MAG: O-antigen ligase family protein, partial [Phycisphaeraceae bacterium]|nr:O-antigen ligase family protein [Phycisphaeraceae bacterium]